MHERDRVAVRSLDRNGTTTYRDGSGERDDPGRRREHRCPRRGADVEPAVLAGRVRIAPEQERAQHRPLHGPCPARRGGRHGQCGSDRSAEEQSDPHPGTSLLSVMQTRLKVAGPKNVVKSDYSEVR
jgi:hypothetical protein